MYSRIALLLMILALPVAGDGAGLASTAISTTSPAAPALGQIKTWLVELADGDESIREQARVKLMGLNRADLLTLQALVRQSPPLLPAQVAALRNRHASLSGGRSLRTRSSGGRVSGRDADEQSPQSQ